MLHRTKFQRRGWKERALSLLLAAALLAGIAPGMTLPASAHWADEYLDQLVDWGVMRADQIGDPDSAISRAEFMAIINRAYGYTQTGPMPFQDVQLSDWFYDDISIAYTAGYMAGTSPTTADPNGTLTREMATCILARNMMMKDTPAESLAFTDSRDVSDWARGLVKTAVDNYIVSGYPDNSFAPQRPVTKGEMAVLITRCIGNPLNQPGDYSLGDVFDNVTITASGVTLRDTTISGDLYVSAGVGLGNVKLENVKVLGRVIVSGTGESEKGDASVVMRNLTADEMLVDNMRDKYVTVRAEGLTQIGKTVVRTPAYLEDNTPAANGLRLITLEGGAGARLDLAGRIKEVVSTAPRANIKVAKGTVQRLTVDENSVDSTVQLDRNTEVKELNLDVASNVTGDGDVDKMNINAPGVTTSILPDNTYIRPGLTGNVGGEEMDSAAAEEASTDPRILSGYPVASDVAPTSLRGDFAANKKGTVYWAVSNITDGSVSADELISKPSYGAKSLKNGSIAVPSASTPVNANITGLTTGGSYYLSAVMVDARGKRSPVKVISFTTPDNSKPAFGTGYPYMSLVTDTLAQATVMPTKSCKLYYAVLPNGAQAPTANELRSASVSGNLGYGVLDVVKNTELTFTASSRLEELKDYVLYLWLSDANGANSSNVQSLKFKTEDRTAPKFSPEASVSTVGATNVSLTVGLNEVGTIYWAVVPRGKTYPLPNNNNPQPGDNVTDSSGVTTASLKSEFAKLQVKNGRNATKKGSLKIAANNINSDVALNITGLARETAYDLYYVGQDSAGNWTEEVKKIAINTLDNTPPTVKQYFNRYTGKDNTRDPLVTTDIMFEFSEDIRSATGAGGGKGLLDLNAALGTAATENAEAREALTDFLSKSIKLYQTSTSNLPVPVAVWDGTGTAPAGSWINFNRATVTSRDGKVIVTLPYNEENPEQSAHHLGSGSTYFFQFQDITDNSDAQNEIAPNPVRYDNMGTTHNIPTFTTVFAQVHLSTARLADDRPIIPTGDTGSPDTNPDTVTDNGVSTNYAYIDYSFQMIPDATQTVDAGNAYDLQLYTNANLAFDLYCRIGTGEKDADGKEVFLTGKDEAAKAGITVKSQDDNDWFYLGNSGPVQKKPEADAGLRGVSVNGNPTMGSLRNFPAVNTLNQKYTYYFVITVTKWDGVNERAVWNGDVEFQVHVLAGGSSDLSNLASDVYIKKMNEYTSRPLTEGGLVSIGETTSGSKFLSMTKTFQDTRVPKFEVGFPEIEEGDSFANLNVTLDRAGTIYYVVAPLGGIGTRGSVTTTTGSGDTGTTTETKTYEGEELWNKLPKEGQNIRGTDGELKEWYGELAADGKTINPIQINQPSAQEIMNSPAYNRYKRGTVPYVGGGALETIPIDELTPRTKYIAYFVLKGVSDTPSQVFAYQFTTGDNARPHITIEATQDGTAGIETQVPSRLRYRMFTLADANNIVELNSTFSAVTNKELPAAYTTGAKKVTSVLDALTTIYDQKEVAAGDANAKKETDTGASIFDLYASDDEKNAIARLIRDNRFNVNTGTSATSVNNGGPRDTTASGSHHTIELTRDDLNKMEFEPTTYVLLVMGHHASSDETREAYEIEAFSGIKNFRMSDTTVPTLIGFTVSGLGRVSSSGRFYGQMTLKFDKDLYWVPAGVSDATKRVMVEQTEGTLVETTSSTVGTVGITHNNTCNGTLSIKTNGKGPRNEFIIDFSGIQLDSNGTASFQLLPGGKFSNVNTQNIDARLEINLFENPKDANGNPMYTNKKGPMPPVYVMVAYWNGTMVSDDVELRK